MAGILAKNQDNSLRKDFDRGVEPVISYIDMIKRIPAIENKKWQERF
jgi:hypothetical protein